MYQVFFYLCFINNPQLWDASNIIYNPENKTQSYKLLVLSEHQARIFNTISLLNVQFRLCHICNYFEHFTDTTQKILMRHFL